LGFIGVGSHSDRFRKAGLRHFSLNVEQNPFIGILFFGFLRWHNTIMTGLEK
jgi:hypothetical protein